MPKKTRKMKQRAALRRSVGAYEESEIVEEAASEAPPRPRFESTARAFSPLTYDYSHIYRDLKLIALFAGFFFAVLIALSFIIK